MQPNHKWVRFHEDTFELKFENLRLREKTLLGRNGLLCDFYVIQIPVPLSLFYKVERFPQLITECCKDIVIAYGIFLHFL